MKKADLSFLIFILSNIMICAQDVPNPNQELMNMLSSKKWFEIEHYYQSNKDKINSEFVLLWYKAETGKVFNKYDESIRAYENLIDKNLLGMDHLTLIQYFAQPLLDVCNEAQKYDKGQVFCKKFISIVENDGAIEENIRKSYTDSFGQAIQAFEIAKQKYPPIEITDIKSDSNYAIPLLKNNSIKTDLIFMAKWNNVPLRTIFDTGAGACYIWNKEIANQIEIRYLSEDTVMMNGNTIKGLFGFVDSLELGKFKIKNVPVFVSAENIDNNDPRQVKCDSALNSQFDIVLGIQLIKQLGTIAFDFTKNTMSFPFMCNHVEKPKNMFIENNGTIRIMSQVTDNDFLAWFDTGSPSGITINSAFYQKNKTKIPIKENKEKSNQYGMIGGCNALSISKRRIFDCNEIDLRINDVKIQLKNDCTVSPEMKYDYQLGAPDGGEMGSGIFKYCHKAVFDFLNMHFYIEK